MRTTAAPPPDRRRVGRGPAVGLRAVGQAFLAIAQRLTALGDAAGGERGEDGSQHRTHHHLDDEVSHPACCHMEEMKGKGGPRRGGRDGGSGFEEGDGCDRGGQGRQWSFGQDRGTPDRWPRAAIGWPVERRSLPVGSVVSALQAQLKVHSGRALMYRHSGGGQRTPVTCSSHASPLCVASSSNHCLSASDSTCGSCSICRSTR